MAVGPSRRSNRHFAHIPPNFAIVSINNFLLLALRSELHKIGDSAHNGEWEFRQWLMKSISCSLVERYGVSFWKIMFWQLSAAELWESFAPVFVTFFFCSEIFVNTTWAQIFRCHFLLDEMLQCKAADCISFVRWNGVALFYYKRSTAVNAKKQFSTLHLKFFLTLVGTGQFASFYGTGGGGGLDTTHEFGP